MAGGTDLSGTGPLYFALVARSEASPYRQALARFQHAGTRFNEIMQYFAEMSRLEKPPTAQIDCAAMERGEAQGIDIEWGAFTTSQQREDLSLLGSEALHGLRTCLDFIVYEASERDSGEARRGTKFPAAETIETRDSKDTQNGVKWLSAPHLKWIRATQPFEGPKWAGDLVRFSNADKHRAAIDLSPTLRFRVDRDRAEAVPDRPNRASFPVSEVQFELLVSDGDRSVSLAKVFPDMFQGVAGLLDKFRGEHGAAPLGLEIEPGRLP